MGLIGNDIKARVPYSKKISSDYQRQKDIMDIYDLNYGDYRDYELIRKYDINYDLFNGRLDVELYDEPICLNIQGEKVKFEYNSITHYPLISQVANAMYGEMISRPFKPMARNIGTSSQTLRDKKWNDLLKELLQIEVIGPIRGEITRNFLKQGNITETLQLTPEELQKMEEAIDQETAKRTPEDVLEFMDNDYKTPTLRQAQRLVDYFVAHQKIKSKQEEGFKHAIITGVEIYYIGEEHGEPTFELVNPKYITWGGSKHTEWIQDATWVKYERWLTLEEATQKYAEFFTKKDYKMLEGYLEPIGGKNPIGDPKRDYIQARTMHELSFEDSPITQKYKDVNYKTKKGQSDIGRLYADIIEKYGADSGYSYSSFGIREVHFCWRDKRKMFKVIRLVDNKEKTFWEDEHYTAGPEDIEVTEIWVDEIWEGTKLGSTGNDDIYINIRPIVGQNKSIYNPFGVHLPYIGKTYNTHMNNAKNVSIIDLGKPWQKEFDVTMAQIKHDMATDFGNLFIMTLEWKPDDMNWQQWFDVMKNSNLLIAQFKKHGFGMDPNMVRNVNLSKVSDIAGKMQLLEMFRANLIRSMNFNDYRIGSIGQYATNQNTEQAQSASYNQTEGWFETHRLIVERAINCFMNRAKFIYRHNEKSKFILDDIARTELEVAPEFWYEEWAIDFSTSTNEIRKVEELRQQMLTFAQNGMSFEGILALSLASTPSDIIDVMKKENRKMDEMRKESQQAQQQELQATLQAQAEEKEKDRQYDYKKHQEKLASDKERTLIDSLKFMKQADADADGQSDVLEKTMMELLAKTKSEREQLTLDIQKHKDEVILKNRELDIKEKQVKAQAKAKAKPSK